MIINTEEDRQRAKDYIKNSNIQEVLKVVDSGKSEEQIQKEHDERWNNIHQGNIIIAEFLGYKYYPQVEGETHPGVWCQVSREAAMRGNATLDELIRRDKGNLFSLRKGYSVYLGRNRRAIDFHRWERIMNVAKHVERAGGKIELTTDLHKTFMNVVDAIKKLV